MKLCFCRIRKWYALPRIDYNPNWKTTPNSKHTQNACGISIWQFWADAEQHPFLILTVNYLDRPMLRKDCFVSSQFNFRHTCNKFKSLTTRLFVDYPKYLTSVCGDKCIALLNTRTSLAYITSHSLRRDPKTDAVSYPCHHLFHSHGAFGYCFRYNHSL